MTGGRHSYASLGAAEADKLSPEVQARPIPHSWSSDYGHGMTGEDITGY